MSLRQPLLVGKIKRKKNAQSHCGSYQQTALLELNYKKGIQMKTENHGALQSETLISFVERVEKKQEHIAAITADIKEIMKEARGIGFEPKMIRLIIKLRKMDADEREENDELTHLYRTIAGI